MPVLSSWRKNVLVRRRRDVTRVVDHCLGQEACRSAREKSYVSRRPSGPIGWWACTTARRCKAGAAVAVAPAASGGTAARLAATTCASCKIGHPCGGAGAPGHPRPPALAAGLAAEAGEDAVRGPARLLRGRGPATTRTPRPAGLPGMLTAIAAAFAAAHSRSTSSSPASLARALMSPGVEIATKGVPFDEGQEAMMTRSQRFFLLTAATWLGAGLLQAAAGPTASSYLRFLEVELNGTGSVTGLGGATGVAVSPDGRNIYAAGEIDDALAVFHRDSATGALTFVEVQKAAVGGGVDGLLGAKAVAISPDGAHVYAAGSLDNAVAVFGRDAATGKLTFTEVQREGQNGVLGLFGAKAVTVSPDGANLYVAGGYDDALVVFGRNPETGMLTYLQKLEDGVGGVNGLNGADAVAVSPDGTHVLVTGSVDDALAVFERDPATGTLTYVERLRDGIAGVDGLHKAQAVDVSPDGASVYAAGPADTAVAVFRVRRCGDGVLDPGEQCDDGNVQDGDCCSSTCRFEPATTLCRPAAGACDLAEFCTGSSSSCLADQLEPSTFECRGALGSCDEAEFCTGTDTACPADAFKPATVECRPAAGDCDVAETCTGTGPTCSPNATSTAVCRPAAGACDVAERCDGVSDDCPADTKSTAVCRPAAGACDVAERCDGVSNDCPTDTKSTAVCRPAAGACDVAERCDGVSEDRKSGV